MPKLEKKFDIPQLIFLGIANIIGAGIYVVGGIAAGIAGPSVIISFIIAGIIATLTALVIAELSSAITDIGESYTYSKKAFGNYIGFIVGFIRLLSSIFSTTSVAIGFSAYLMTFFFSTYNSSFFLYMISISVIVLSCILNIVGISKMIKFATILTIFKIFALSFFVILGFYYLIENFDPNKLIPPFPNGFKSTLEASSLVFFAYIGFQTIALASEETKNPKKNIPLAIFFTMLFCSILYVLISLIQVASVHWYELKNVEYSLLYITRKITDNYIVNLLITSSALAAMLSVLLTTVYSSSRIAYALAKDGFLPSFFKKINEKYKTPLYSVIISSLLSIFVLTIKNLSTLISFVSFGYLVIFLITHLSLMKLKKKIRPKFELPFYPSIPIISIFLIIVLLLFLENTAKILGIAFILVGTLIYFFLTKKK
ncbi:MAG: amino acid permease [Candidatus Aenigmatarchaeota archaeon]